VTVFHFGICHLAVTCFVRSRRMATFSARRAIRIAALLLGSVFLITFARRTLWHCASRAVAPFLAGIGSLGTLSYPSFRGR
jgi:hypothetical protein